VAWTKCNVANTFAGLYKLDEAPPPHHHHPSSTAHASHRMYYQSKLDCKHFSLYFGFYFGL
jgi:hypothetical protein